MNVILRNWFGFGKFVFMVATMVVISTIAFARPEPNAFLNKPAKTHTDLINQVKNDPQVMDRYMRHFGLGRDDVVSKLLTLQKGHLDQDGTYYVYNVPDSGVVRVRTFRLKKGTPVWLDSDGKPMLKWSCGNPMRRGTDLQTMVIEPTVVDNSASTKDIVVATEPSDEIVVLLPTPPEVPEAEGIEIIPPGPTIENPIVTATSGQDTITMGSGLAGLLLHSSWLVGGYLTTRGGDSPTPEPVTIITLAAGAGYLALRKRKASR